MSATRIEKRIVKYRVEKKDEAEKLSLIHI